ESFNPQSSLTMLDMAGNYITTPEQGKQLEIGIKQDLFDGRAMLSAAVFRIDKKNMAMPAQEAGQCDVDAAPAPGTPGTTDGMGDCRMALNGLQRSQGIELDLTVTLPIGGAHKSLMPTWTPNMKKLMINGQRDAALPTCPNIIFRSGTSSEFIKTRIMAVSILASA